MKAADTVAPARDKHLKHLEDDLRFIMRQAERIKGNYELAEAIFRAAHDSLSEYELELLPGTDDAAA